MRTDPHPTRRRIPSPWAAVLAVALSLAALAASAAPAVAQAAPRAATLQGRVYERESRQPVAGVIVTLGRLGSIRTDASGRFEIEAPGPGELPLTVQHPDGGRDSSTVLLRVGINRVEIAVRPRTVALQGIEVTVVPTRDREMDRRRNVSQYVLEEEDVDRYARRGVRMVDVLQTRFPVRLRELSGSFGVCVEGRRGAPTIFYKNVRPSTGPGCDMLDVFLDGVRLADPGIALRTMSLDDIESIELLSPLASSMKAGAYASSGVLLIEMKRGLPRPASRPR